MCQNTHDTFMITCDYLFEQQNDPNNKQQTKIFLNSWTSGCVRSDNVHGQPPPAGTNTTPPHPPPSVIQLGHDASQKAASDTAGYRIHGLNLDT